MLNLVKSPSFEIDSGLSGSENMCKDACLLENLQEIGIRARVYTWSQPWVTLGKFQNPATDLKANCPIPYVMRPTGGRAVLHGHDITIGLAIALSSIASGDEDVALLSRSVRRVYRIAVAPIISALQSCGIDAVLGEEIKGLVNGPKSADCFANVSANDVVDRRTLRKVCGVAMLLTKEAVLVQASIPIREPLVDLAVLYEFPAPVFPVSVSKSEFELALEHILRQFD